ncbi:MAG: ribonuclease [Thermoplasmata archaeon]|jgi:ribonuclease HI|nr:ribonuclease [Thermoplasmata archaeon]
MAWRLQFDGLYEPRLRPDGIATYGFLVERDGTLAHQEHGVALGPGEGGDAHVAEFAALIRGLAWLADHKQDAEPLQIEGDSRLAIETVAGRWNLTSERLLPLRDWARRLLAALPGEATLRKIGRDENARADALSREAYHAWKRERADAPSRPPPRL